MGTPEMQWVEGYFKGGFVLNFSISDVLIEAKKGDFFVRGRMCGYVLLSRSHDRFRRRS